MYSALLQAAPEFCLTDMQTPNMAFSIEAVPFVRYFPCRSIRARQQKPKHARSFECIVKRTYIELPAYFGRGFPVSRWLSGGHQRSGFLAQTFTLRTFVQIVYPLPLCVYVFLFGVCFCVHGMNFVDVFRREISRQAFLLLLQQF